MPTMRETLRHIAVILGSVRDMAGLTDATRETLANDAAALRTLATRMDAELADTQGDASSLAWHIQRVLLRLDAPVEP